MNITLYTTHCPKCKVLETKLKQKGITYTEVTDTDIMLSMNIDKVPVLQVDNTLMDFATANKFINNLE